MTDPERQAARGAPPGQEDSGAPGPRLRAPDGSPPVSLHIAELVLHGFAPADRYRIGDSVELELARLFAERGVPPHLVRGGEVSELDGGSFESSPDGTPEVLGVRIARAIYKGITR